MTATDTVDGTGTNNNGIYSVGTLTAKTVNGTRTATTNTGGGDSFGLFLDGTVTATNINGTGVMGIYVASTVNLGTATNSIVGTGTQSYGIYAVGAKLTVSKLIRGNTPGSITGLYFKNCTIDISTGSIIGRVSTSDSSIKAYNVYTCGGTLIYGSGVVITGGTMTNTCPAE